MANPNPVFINKLTLVFGGTIADEGTPYDERYLVGLPVDNNYSRFRPLFSAIYEYGEQGNTKQVIIPSGNQYFYITFEDISASKMKCIVRGHLKENGNHIVSENTIEVGITLPDTSDVHFEDYPNEFEFGAQLPWVECRASGVVHYLYHADVINVPVEDFADRVMCEYAKDTFEYEDYMATGVAIYGSIRDHDVNEYRRQIGHVEPYNATLTADFSSVPAITYWTDEVREIDTSGITAVFRCGNYSQTINSPTISIVPSYRYEETVTYSINVSFTLKSNTYVTADTRIGSPNSLVAVAVSGSDDDRYTDSWVTPFAYPNITITGTLMDGSTISFPVDSENVAYYNDKNFTLPLVPGTKVQRTDRIYLRVSYRGGTATGYYEIRENKDVIVDLAMTKKPAYVLYATKRGEYDGQFAFTATYKSGIVKENWTDYFIGMSDYFLISAPADFQICDKASSFKKYFYLTDIAKNPDSCEFFMSRLGNFKSKLNNKRDAIDLSQTGFAVRYFYKGKQLSYVPETPFDMVKHNITCSIDGISGAEAFDGSTPVNLTMSGVATYGTITIPYSETILSTNGSLKLNISVIAMTNVAYIRYGKQVAGGATSFKTFYQTGSTFLGDDDPSNVYVGFTDSEGNILEENVLLNEASNVLNIYPAPGTLLSEEGTFTVRVSSIFDSAKNLSYSFVVKRNVHFFDSKIPLSLKPWKLKSALTVKRDWGEATLSAGTYVLVESKNLSWVNGAPTLNGEIKNDEASSIKVYGYLKDIGSTSQSSVVLLDDYIPPISGDSNVIVKFPCHVEGASDFVDKCRFGIRFGHNNSLNRLFISGNPEKPNYDIHTLEPNWNNRLTSDQGKIRPTAGDYSYISDEAIQKYGEEENAIVGYDIVSDSKLLVLKNKVGKERTVYFRSPTLVQAIGSSGTAMASFSGALYQEEFAISMSNSPVGGISPQTICNFGGDTLFLSEDNRIEGLNIEGIIGDSQRQASTRSAYIDKAIEKQDLSDPILYASGRNCYFSTGDHLYVANRDEYASGQYEWWEADKTGANCFFTDAEGTVCFGDKHGNLFAMKDGCFEDSERYFLGMDNSMYSVSVMPDSSISIPQSVLDKIDGSWVAEVHRSEKAKDNLFERVLDVKEGTEFEVVSEGVIATKSAEALYYVSKRLFAGCEAFVCPNSVGEIDSEGVLYNSYKGYQRLTIKKCDDVDFASGYLYAFSLVDEHGDVLPIPVGATFGVARIVDGEYSMVIGETNKQIYLYSMDDPVSASKGYQITLITMAQSSVSNPFVCLAKKKPVKSEFVTAPFLIDTANYDKFVHKVDIINGSKEPCDLEVGQYPFGNDTPSNNRYVKTTFPTNVGRFNFEAIDFGDANFGKSDSAIAWTMPRSFAPRRFFSLALKSDKPQNSVLPGVEITYSYHRLSKGSE